MDTKEIKEEMGGKILKAFGAKPSAEKEWEEERISEWAQALAEEACMSQARAFIFHSAQKAFTVFSQRFCKGYLTRA